MEWIDVDAVDSDSRLGVHRQALSASLVTSDLEINRYRVEPGGRIAGLHAHGDQEVFNVVDGRLTVETLDGAVVVEWGAVRFAPGDHESAVNDGTTRSRSSHSGHPGTARK